MKEEDVGGFWDGCPLVGRDPEMVHGAPVLRNEHGELTRMPVSALTGNVEAFMEIEGITEDQAIEATLDCFPGVSGGEDTLRKILAYREAGLRRLLPF